MSVHRNLAISLLLLTSLSMVARDAEASPWTLPKDLLLLSLNYDFQFAEQEYLPDGTFQSFPLNGRFSSSTLRLGGRYGLTSKFEFAAELMVKSVNYAADPVILALPEGQDSVDLDEARASIVDFSSNRLGPADMYLTARYNFVKTMFALANETRIKLPTGYKPPQGTFDQETGAVADDVALGDGQTDLENSILVGVFLPETRTFARADLGFRLRFGGPGHQVIGGAKIGQSIGQHLVIFGGASGAYTVNEGEVIGSTLISTVDDLQSSEVEPGVNAVSVDLRLDKNWVSAEGGVLLPVGGVELQVAYSHVVHGANIPAIQTVSIGTAIRFDDLTAQAE